MLRGTPTVNENTPLIIEGIHDSTSDDIREVSHEVSFRQSPQSALPIALISALAVAATAATQIHAYATLVCKDARNCDQEESRRLASAVAVATTAANICALLSLRGFQALSQRHSQWGLFIWLLVRCLSVGALSLGGQPELLTYCFVARR